MSVDQQHRSKSALSKRFIDLQDHRYLNGVMDVRTSSATGRNNHIRLTERTKLEYSRSFSQGHSGRMFRYFTLESLFLLVCLTVSLLILPLVLPPLPPPPFLLLLVPICILALLMFLAFMPSDVRDATYTYV